MRNGKTESLLSALSKAISEGKNYGVVSKGNMYSTHLYLDLMSLPLEKRKRKNALYRIRSKYSVVLDDIWDIDSIRSTVKNNPHFRPRKVFPKIYPYQQDLLERIFSEEAFTIKLGQRV